MFPNQEMLPGQEMIPGFFGLLKALAQLPEHGSVRVPDPKTAAPVHQKSNYPQRPIP
jgi:hypothetical protein